MVSVSYTHLLLDHGEGFLIQHPILGLENVVDIDQVGHGGLDAGDIAGALDDDLKMCIRDS